MMHVKCIKTDLPGGFFAGDEYLAITDIFSFGTIWVFNKFHPPKPFNIFRFKWLQSWPDDLRDYFKVIPVKELKQRARRSGKI